MALRIKSYPNMNTLSIPDVSDTLTKIEIRSANNGIGHETKGCVFGEKQKMEQFATSKESAIRK